MVPRKPPEGFLDDTSGLTTFGDAESWYQLVGPLFYASDNQPGKVRMGFYSEQRYISSMNRVHGGMMSSFMDYLLFNTAHSAWDDTGLATVSLNVHFVGICPRDVWVEGYGEVIRAGKTMAFVSGEARTDNKVIVHGSGTFRKLAKPIVTAGRRVS